MVFVSWAIHQLCFNYITNAAWDPSQEAGVIGTAFACGPITDPIVSDKDSVLSAFGDHEW
jgi:hypothetical protein